MVSNESEGEERLVSLLILSIRAWLPAETVNGMRWCNPRAHTGDTRTVSLSLSLFRARPLVPSRQ